MAGLTEVPVTVCNRELDAYAQVAENQKRRGLSALDLARFIRSRVTMGESNAQISRRLGLDQTTIAHHLALLDLPPVLEAALLSGRRVHRHLGAALGAHRAVGGCPAVTPVGVRRRTVMGTPVHVSRLCRWLEGAFSSKVACSTRG
jgi:ParB-like chromosome segregation protein Spo0J